MASQPVAEDPYQAQEPGLAILNDKRTLQQLSDAGFSFASLSTLRRSIPLKGFGVTQSIASLQGSDFLEYFPADPYGGLQHIENHHEHPCPRVAAAANVHQLTVALLAEAFMVLEKPYRLLGYLKLYLTYDAAHGTYTAPEFIGSNQRCYWSSMTNTERAAMLLFVDPPTKVLHQAACIDKETCIRVCRAGHRR